MNTIHVDFSKIIGEIKAMHAVGQPPFRSADFSYIKYLEDAHIPYSRLHDVGGPFGKNLYVDIPNLFRDFHADENDPASYDFAFTDELIRNLIERKVEPIFRLGVTIETGCHIKAYRIHPPEDFGKWARICEHVVRHYNEGWADGFHYGITYWEIWNEPDNNPVGNKMWTGTREQFYELYDIAAKHLKSCFGDSIKIGGYGACGFHWVLAHPKEYGLDAEPDDNPLFVTENKPFRLAYSQNFFRHLRESGAPLDFFSWHSYFNVTQTVNMAKYLDILMKENGFENVETQMNEWNNAHDSALIGSSYASANAVAMMIAMHKTKTKILCYYDARIGVSSYGGMFNAMTIQPVSTYYAFRAFGELYVLGNEAELSCDIPGVYALAAVNADKRAILLSNTNESRRIVRCEAAKGFHVYSVTKTHFLQETEKDPEAFMIGPYEVLLLTSFALSGEDGQQAQAAPLDP